MVLAHIASPTWSLLVVQNVLTAFLFAGLFGSPACADGHASVVVECAIERVSASGANLVEATSACRAAATAASRLRALGLNIREDVRIEVTEQMPLRIFAGLDGPKIDGFWN
jgi:hypothetical protein